MPDTLLAVVPRQNLSAVLTGFHRGGYGHLIRTLDPERASITSQLQRAGIEDARLTSVEPTEVVVFVPAPGRTTQAAAVAMANGAVDVELVTRGAAISETVAPRLITHAGSRRERRTSRRTPAIPPAVDGRSDVIAD